MSVSAHDVLRAIAPVLEPGDCSVEELFWRHRSRFFAGPTAAKSERLLAWIEEQRPKVGWIWGTGGLHWLSAGGAMPDAGVPLTADMVTADDRMITLRHLQGEEWAMAEYVGAPRGDEFNPLGPLLRVDRPVLAAGREFSWTYGVYYRPGDRQRPTTALVALLRGRNG
jgi:hypothetical protein